MTFRKPYSFLFFIAGVVGVNGLLAAQTTGITPEPQAVQEPQDPWTQEQLSGDWRGLRERLAADGIHFDPYLVIDGSKNINGGLDTQGDAFRHLFSFNFTFELATLLGWESGKIFVDFQNRNGQNGSDEVGDFQFVGNWDADGLTQIGELWFEYELDDGAVRLKLGKVDANNEFAYTELGWEFVHGSASFPATNALMPTYPDPAASINVFFYPDDSTSIGFGLYDGSLQEGFRTGSRGPSTFFGNPADLFLIIEITHGNRH